MEEVFFNGVVGRLEGRFHRSESPRAPLVLILHPNPTQGGTMNNRVTYALFQAFVDMGFSVLRFNYRGVGYSQGQVDGTGVGELADAIVALDWLQSQDTEANQCWVVGYSFGAWIAAQVLMRRPEIKGFTFVTPPTSIYDFNFLSPCPSSGLIVQGARDEIVDENGVAMLANSGDSSDSGKIQANRLKLRKAETVVLCCLWTVYVDRIRRGNLSKGIVITLLDLKQELEKFGFREDFDGKTLMAEILKLFSKYNLVEVSGKVGEPDCSIKIYPSIQFALDSIEFQSFVEETCKKIMAAKSSSDDDEEEGEKSDYDE